MDGTFIVYILQNLSGKQYIGITRDIDRRVQSHNEGFSTYTRNKGPWSLIWKSKKMSHKQAPLLEKQLKKQHGGKGLSTLMKLHIDQ